MNRRRDNENGPNSFGRNAETIYREQLRSDKRFGDGWANDWDSNPGQQNGSYRGGPRNMHWSDDRDYSNREGHGYYVDDNSGTIYGGGNRGRGDYGRGSSYGRRGYYDRGTYFEDAGRYTPRFHERREYDEYDRDAELNGQRMNPRASEGRSYEREAFSARQRDGYDPRQDREREDRERQERERNDRSRDRSMRFGREEYDDRFGANYRSDNEHQHWYQGDQNEQRHTAERYADRDDDRRRRDEHRGFTPGDAGGQYGGRNTW
jgi:hypothetical protein